MNGRTDHGAHVGGAPVVKTQYATRASLGSPGLTCSHCELAIVEAVNVLHRSAIRILVRGDAPKKVWNVGGAELSTGNRAMCTRRVERPLRSDGRPVT